ncbi:Host cell factor 2 [Cichlidogyrus casuarinus]|uniref:Host cell factor 2 n=1 Tax=Cichlidogyrus casuarinus TaxID=1844966 RepID=A0ABD2QL09_9PLAT
MKRHTPVVSGLITLGKKRPGEKPSDNVAKKTKLIDFYENSGQDLLLKVEELITSSDYVSVENLIIATLTKMQKNFSPASANQNLSHSFSRPGTSMQIRQPLNPATSCALLHICKTHPNIFTRAQIQECLISCLGLHHRDFSINLPATAISALTGKIKPFLVLIANLLQMSLIGVSKWPSKLLKVYLDDSLGDRVWVDQEECQIFVANIETAFQPNSGEPRPLISLLVQYSQSKSIECAPSMNKLLQLLGLITPPSSLGRLSFDPISQTVEEIISESAKKNLETLYGISNPQAIVVSRFDSNRKAATNVMVTNRLRETLLPSSSNQSQPSQSVPIARSKAVAAANASASLATIPGTTSSSSNQNPLYIRSAIKTLAIAVGVAEVRNLVMQKIEPWFTNPKLMVPCAGLFALICQNCDPVEQSHFDLGILLNCVFRLRFKFFKTQVQCTILDSLCRLCVSQPSTLSPFVRICLVGAEQFSGTGNDLLYPNSKPCTKTLELISLKKVLAGFVRGIEEPLLEQLLTSVAQPHPQKPEAVFMLSSSACFFFPALYVHFDDKITRILSDSLHTLLVQSSAIVAGDTMPDIISLVSMTQSELPALLPQASIASFVQVQMINYRLLLRTVFKWLKPLFGQQSDSNGSTVSRTTIAHLLSHRGETALKWPFSEIAAKLLLDGGCAPPQLDGYRSPSEHSAVATLLGQMEFACPDKNAATLLVAFQLYNYALAQLIVQLQCCSALRPQLWSSDEQQLKNQRKSVVQWEHVKPHLNAVKSIRKSYVRWFRVVLPQLVCALSAAYCKESAAEPLTIDVETCKHAIITNSLPGQLMRHVFFIHASTPLRWKLQENIMLPPEDAAAAVEPCDYSLQDCSLFNVDMLPSHTGHAGGNIDMSQFCSLLTDVPSSEKMLIHILSIGLEGNQISHEGPDSKAPSSGPIFLMTSVDTCDLVCDLIFRSCLYLNATCEAGSRSDQLTFNKVEQMTNLMFASCGFMHEQQQTNEAPALAYAFLYWKVSVALCCLAAFSPRSLGTFAWSNLPTVKQLMELLICDQLESLHTSYVSGDANEFDAMLLQEQQCLAQENEFIQMLHVNQLGSSLIGKLTRNDPRGPARLPPQAILSQLSLYNQYLQLNKRLWSCREPDFLVALLESRSISSERVLRQPWLPFFLSDSSSNFSFLPLPCLAEYLLYEVITFLEPVPAKFCTFSHDSSNPFSRLFQAPPREEKPINLDTCEKILARLRESLKNSENVPKIMSTFLKRLGIKGLEKVRHAAIKSLCMVFGSCPIEHCLQWAQTPTSLGFLGEEATQIVATSLQILNLSSENRTGAEEEQNFLNLLMNLAQMETQPTLLTALIHVLRHLICEEHSTILPNDVLCKSLFQFSECFLDREAIFVALLHSKQGRCCFPAILQVYLEIHHKLDVFAQHASDYGPKVEVNGKWSIPLSVFEVQLSLLSLGADLVDVTSEPLLKELQSLWNSLKLHPLGTDDNQRTDRISLRGLNLFALPLSRQKSFLTAGNVLLFNMVLQTADPEELLQSFGSISSKRTSNLQLLYDKMQKDDSLLTNRLLRSKMQTIENVLKIPEKKRLYCPEKKMKLDETPSSSEKKCKKSERNRFLGCADANKFWSLFFESILIGKGRQITLVHNFTDCLSEAIEYYTYHFDQELKKSISTQFTEALERILKSPETTPKLSSTSPFEQILALASEEKEFALNLALFVRALDVLHKSEILRTSNYIKSLFFPSTKNSTRKQRALKPVKSAPVILNDTAEIQRFFKDSSVPRHRKLWKINRLINGSRAEQFHLYISTLLDQSISEAVDVSMVLDFFQSVLHAPQFSYPVKLTDSRDRDLGSNIALMYMVDSPLVMIQLALRELSAIIETHGMTSASGMKLAKKLFDLRQDLFLLLFQQCPQDFMQILLQEAKISQHECGLGTDARMVASRLILLCTYWRLPCTIAVVSDSDEEAWLTEPSNDPKLVTFLNQHMEQLPAFDKLGSTLLVGLVGASSEVDEQSNSAAIKANQLVRQATQTQTNCSNTLISLALKHSRACLRLLPSLNAILNGRILMFDLSERQTTWTKFTQHRLNLTVEMVLNFLEVLAWPRSGPRSEYPCHTVPLLSADEATKRCPLFTLEAQHFSASLEEILVNLLNVLLAFQQSLGKHITNVYERICMLVCNHYQAKQFLHSSAQSTQSTENMQKCLNALLGEATASGNFSTLHPIFSRVTLNAIRSALLVVNIFCRGSQPSPPNQIPKMHLGPTGVILDCTFHARFKDLLENSENSQKEIRDLLNYVDDTFASKPSLLEPIRELLVKTCMAAHLSTDLVIKALKLLHLLCQQNVYLGVEELRKLIIFLLQDEQRLSHELFSTSIFVDLFQDLCLWIPNEAPRLMMLLAFNWMRSSSIFAATKENSKINSLADLLISTLDALSMESLHDVCVQNASSSLTFGPTSNNKFSQSKKLTIASNAGQNSSSND